MSESDRWYHPARSLAADGWDVVVDDALPGWRHTGLLCATLEDGESRTIGSTGRTDLEYVVVPLAGSASVRCVDARGDTHDAELTGRTSVFAGPTDVAYLPPGSTTTLRATGPLRVAVAVAAVGTPDGSAVRPADLPFRRMDVADVPVELRGAGAASREVRNFGTPGVLDAHSLIACEVVTPAGNWSSFPPHKHDEQRPGVESELEEIYYFEAQVTDGREPGGAADPVGYQRVYGTADRPIEVFAEVRSGDVVLVPHGWHGPSMAAPGYDLYYLNVMAGPGPERAWRICDDPSHTWVRSTWPDQPIDPRLPMGGTR